MSKTTRQPYDDIMREAATLPETTKMLKVEDCINRIRKDRRVKPLTLCAFLQDHAKVIRESLDRKAAATPDVDRRGQHEPN